MEEEIKNITKALDEFLIYNWEFVNWQQLFLNIAGEKEK